MKVIINSTTVNKLRAYAKIATPNEIGGLCSVVPIDGGYKVLDGYITKQEVNGGHFELCEDAQVELERERYKAKAKGELAMIWHSHVNMGVSPSGNDDRVLKEHAEQGPTLSLIINNKGENSCHYQAVMKDDNGIGMLVKTRCEVTVVDDSIDYKALEAEVKAKCIPEKPKYMQPISAVGRYNPRTGKAEYNSSRRSNTVKAEKETESQESLFDGDDELDLSDPEIYEMVKESFEALQDTFSNHIRVEASEFGIITPRGILEYYAENYRALIGL